MDDPVARLIEESEKLIAQVQANSFERFLESQGLKPDELEAMIQSRLSPAGRDEARDVVADDLASINREVEEEAQRRGLDTAPRAASGLRQRRRMGMV